MIFLKSSTDRVRVLLDEFKQNGLVPDSGCLCIPKTGSMIKLLLTHSVGIDVNGTWNMSWRTGDWAITSLHWAIETGRVHVVRELLKAGADRCIMNERCVSSISRCIELRERYGKDLSPRREVYERIISIVLSN